MARNHSRSDENEPARRPSAVDGGLERGEERRNTLDLVEDRAVRKVSSKAEGIGLRAHAGDDVV